MIAYIVASKVKGSDLPTPDRACGERICLTLEDAETLLSVASHEFPETRWAVWEVEVLVKGKVKL